MKQKELLKFSLYGACSLMLFNIFALPEVVFALEAQKGKLDRRSETFKLKVEQKGITGSQKNQKPLSLFLKPEFGALDNPGQEKQLKAKAHLDLLAKYDLELIVDKSFSMRKRDCPGGLSRWDWCGIQARQMAEELAKLSPSGFTLATFSTNYEINEHAKSDDIARLFANPRFGRDTMLSKPLSERLDSFFKNFRPGHKPKVIAIITDGLPWPIETEPTKVEQVLIKASQRIKKHGDLQVVFFQIGDLEREELEAKRWTQKGEQLLARRLKAVNNRRQIENQVKQGIARQEKLLEMRLSQVKFLKRIDSELVSNGAKVDFVSTVRFNELMSLGLARALEKSIRQFEGTTVESN